MDTYSILREFADSWVLLAMICFFIAVIIWAFLPSQRGARHDASLIPFDKDVINNDCSENCETCKCKAIMSNFQEETNE